MARIGLVCVACERRAGLALLAETNEQSGKRQVIAARSAQSRDKRAGGRASPTPPCLPVRHASPKPRSSFTSVRIDCRAHTRGRSLSKVGTGQWSFLTIAQPQPEGNALARHLQQRAENKWTPLAPVLTSQKRRRGVPDKQASSTSPVAFAAHSTRAINMVDRIAMRLSLALPSGGWPLAPDKLRTRVFYVSSSAGGEKSVAWHHVKSS